MRACSGILGTRLVCVALAAVPAIGGCAESPPTAASLRPDMAAAVQAAASAATGAPSAVQYELHSRCEPNDEVLDGLTLRASTPSSTAADDPTALDRMAEASDQGLQVERSSQGPEQLRASPDSRLLDADRHERPEPGRAAVHASGVVAEEPRADGVEVVSLCG